MLKTIAIVVVVLLTAILVYAATMPDDFRVQRTTSIKAPPEKIFALINDFHRWDSWSPWEKMDPAMKRTYSGAAAGKGTVYAWRLHHGGQDKRAAWRLIEMHIKI
jgi:Polyketide cyclase / dehydrase and lipid transport